MAGDSGQRHDVWMTSGVMTLPDRSRLSWHEFGDPGGSPVIYTAGTRSVAPGSRRLLAGRRHDPHRGRRVHSISNFLSLLAVRVARDERQEIVQRHGEITPGAALCIAVSVPP